MSNDRTRGPRSWRWPAGAVMVAIAAAGFASFGRTDPAPRAAPVDGELEARILAERIDYLEGLYRRSSQHVPNPVVGALLVDDHLLRFRLSNDLEHLQRALELAEALAPLALDQATARARLALTRLSLHDFEGALLAARAGVGGDSSSEAALGVYFDASVAAGEYAEAEAALDRLEEAHSGSVTTEVRAARWYAALGDDETAWAALEPTCRRLDGSLVARAVVAWCQTLLGELAHGRQGPDAARRWYRRALETQPSYMAAIEGLADLDYAQGHWSDARQRYERIVGDAHPDLSLRLSEVTRAEGDERAAERYEARFLELATASGAEPLNGLPLATYYAGRPETHDRALQLVSRDLDRRSSIDSWETAAWVRFQRGEYEAALEASDEARAWGAPGASSDYVRAEILAALGRNDEAALLRTSALEDPTALDHHLLLHRSTSLPSESRR